MRLVLSQEKPEDARSSSRLGGKREMPLTLRPTDRVIVAWGVKNSSPQHPGVICILVLEGCGRYRVEHIMPNEQTVEERLAVYGSVVVSELLTGIVMQRDKAQDAHI